MLRSSVLIVHSDACCRERVAQLLARSDIDVVDVVPHGEEAISAARRRRPDLVLMGAGRNGAAREATRRMTLAAPHSRVLLFGDAAAEEELDSTMSAGAAGYVRVDGPKLDVTVRIALALIAFREVAQYERGAV
jgi:DNA-binding NarL/FixJ family response regulator